MVVATNISTATCVVVAIVAAATGAVCSHVHRAGASSHDGACTSTQLVKVNAAWAGDTKCSMGR